MAIETPQVFLKRLGQFSIGPIIGAGIGFITVPITTRLVSPSIYGQLSMFNTATSLGGALILLGVDQAYVREYSTSRNRASLWYTSLSLPLLLALIIGAMVFFRPLQVSRLLFGQESFLAAAGVAFAFPILVFHRYSLLAVRMAEDGVKYSVMQISAKAVTALLTIGIVLWLGPGLNQILYPIVIGYVVVICIGLLSGYTPGIRQASIDPASLKRLLAFGLPIVASSALLWILNSLDKVALRAWSTFEEMGIYSAAFRLSAIIMVVQQAFNSFWAPTSYRWFESGVKASRYQHVTDIAAMGLTMLYATLIALRWVIIWLLGPEYREAVHLLPLAAIFPIMVIMSETTVMGIGFSRKTYWATVVTGLAAIMNIAGNWVLVPRYGAFGAALSTAVSFTGYFWFRTVVSNELWEGVRVRMHLAAHAAMGALVVTSLVYANWIADVIAGGVVVSIFGFLLLHRIGKLRTRN